jgi:DNA (cytosine-5)-methyltransferase 1
MEIQKMEKLKVVELFAGVGGFRLGLEGWIGNSSSSNYKETLVHAGFENREVKVGFETIWSNQWEPSTKRQHASEVYKARFGEQGHINESILDVIENVPEHDVLVGGFPCQDYSVASTLRNSGGLQGRKGVLWWAIEGIIAKAKNKPQYLILENVDRLLKSPANQRGRDFAIMLSSLCKHDYIVEWRVINAADYCMPQKRRRVFILAYHKDCPVYSKAISNPREFIEKEGVLASAFPAMIPHLSTLEISDDIVEISNEFNSNNRHSPFQGAGIMVEGKVYSGKHEPVKESLFPLKDILDEDFENIAEEFWIEDEKINKWIDAKSAKKEKRTTVDGYTYYYSVGNMLFPDSLIEPARTIVTSEGGSMPSRFKHIILDPRNNKYRRLTPSELERANMFPYAFTSHNDITSAKRAFFMGNALVVGVVERIGKSLLDAIRIDKY